MAEMILQRVEQTIALQMGENTGLARDAALRAEAVLADAGFVLVAGDLAGADTIGTVATNIAAVTAVSGAIADIGSVAGALTAIGTVATNIASVNIVAANAADVATVATDLGLGASSLILQAIDAAADALTAAASVYVTSSAHALSSGDRTATAIANGGSFTTTLTPSGGTILNLINGNVTNDNSNAITLTGIALTGHELFHWIFPLGRSLICDSVTIKNSGTQSYGAATFYALKNDGTWVAVSTSSNIGGATSVTIALTAIDKGGYLGLKCVFDSGTAGSGRMLEIEFKFANGAQDTLYKIPPETVRGKVLTQQSANPGDVVFAEPIDFNAAAVSGAGLLCEYFFNEGTGETVYDRSGNGRHIVFDSSHRATYGGAFGTNYSWTKRGLLLRKAMIQSPSLTSTRTVVAVYVPLREDGSNVQWNVSNNTAINSNHARMASGGSTQSTQTVHVGHGGEGVVPLYRDASTNGYAISRGGPLMVFSESSAGITGNLGMGGQCNVTADTVRSTQMVCVYFAVYSGTLTSDQRTAIRRALRRSLAVRGIRIDWRDCDTVHAGAFNIGQSNTGNLSISPADLSAANIAALSFTPNTFILSAGRRDEATPMATPSEYRAGFNSFPGFRALGMGYEAGMALAHEKANASARRKLAICKVAAGSSNISDATALSWNASVPPGTGMLGFALKSWRDLEQHFLNRGEGVRLFAVNTQNGEQEANNTGVANGWPAAYQANMQGIWDKLKEQLLFDGLKINVGELFPFDTGQSNYTQAGVDAVRAAQTAFVLANADASLVASAAGLKQADKIHITADNSVSRGELDFYPVQGIF